MNFKELNFKLLPNIRSLLSQWLPGGTVSGQQFNCASRDGGKGKSFTVNLKTGLWGEFAGDERGGDLISLYAELNGISQGQAYTALGGEPEIIPSMRHSELGNPSSSWCYRSIAGNPILYVSRYDHSQGKTFLPWTQNGNGWVCKNLPAPRPLYGLDLLADNPIAPILIVEGEKAADSARTIAQGFIVVTWPVGAANWNKADWSVLFNRSVIVIWPDADAPGIKAAQGIATVLAPQCKSIKILDVADRPLGWDAHDAISEGMTQSELFAWMEKTVELNPLPVSTFSLESVSTLLAKPEPSLTWLIEGLWTDQSKGLIAGNPNIGKTWLALDMLISIVSGELCLGQFKPPVRAPGLLIEEEASHLNLSRRIHALARGRGLSHASLSELYHMTHQFPKIPTHEKELISLIRGSGVKLVVFDSLRRFHTAKENSSDEMQAVLDSFSRIGLETGASVILLHHLSKSGNDQSVKKPIFERMRGTSDLWAWRDCLIGLEGEEESDTSLCSFQFRDAENPMPIRIKRTIDEATGAIKLVAVALEDSEETAEKIGLILAYMKSQFGAPSKDKILKNVKGRKQDMNRIFKLMEKKKIVVKEGEGWIVPDLAERVGTTGTGVVPETVPESL